MSLSLSVSTPVFALHVSDRLASKRGAPSDPLANKSVVFRASDALLAVGYAGPPFLHRLPADAWIARVLSGGACPSEPGAISYGPFPIVDLESSLALLSRELQARRTFGARGGEVCGVGWQWNPARARSVAHPVLWRLRGRPGQWRWEQPMPRDVPDRRMHFRMSRAGDWPLGADWWHELIRRVAAAGDDAQEAERLLIDAIRCASRERPRTVGAHCISIRVRRSGFPNALVRLHPATPRGSRAGDEAGVVAYTPWMVAPDAVHAPSVCVGRAGSEDGLLTYSIGIAASKPPIHEALAPR